MAGDNPNTCQVIHTIIPSMLTLACQVIHTHSCILQYQVAHSNSSMVSHPHTSLPIIQRLNYKVCLREIYIQGTRIEMSRCSWIILPLYTDFKKIWVFEDIRDKKDEPLMGLWVNFWQAPILPQRRDILSSRLGSGASISSESRMLSTSYSSPVVNATRGDDSIDKPFLGKKSKQ